MEELVELYLEKNHFLKKFYLLNERELANFKKSEFANLDYFYQQRDKIIDIIGFIKEKIEKLEAYEEFRDLHEQPRLAEIETKNIQLTHDILKQDSEILELIEAAKNNIIKELQKIKVGKKIVGKYKGYSEHKKIDEQA